VGHWLEWTKNIKDIRQLADGFISQNRPPSSYKDDFTVVREAAEKAGRDPTKMKGIFVGCINF